MGSRYALIVSLINSASDWASASPSTCPSLSTPNYREPPVVLAKALTDLSQVFFFFLSSSLLKSYVEHSATNLVSMVSISQISKYKGIKLYAFRPKVLLKEDNCIYKISGDFSPLIDSIRRPRLQDS